jgi:acetolactate synthase-1/2/3 large subunit
VFGRGWEQEGIDASLDIASLFKNAVSYSAICTDAQNFQTLLTTALRVSRAIPGRASHLSVPLDIQNLPATGITVPSSPSSYRAQTGAHDPAAAAVVLNELLAAKRPLIFLGNGCRQALRSGGLSQFQSFVERFGIPVMTTLDGKGIFPETHLLSLRAFGKSGCMWPAAYLSPPPSAPGAAPFDYLLVIGSMCDRRALHEECRSIAVSSRKRARS